MSDQQPPAPSSASGAKLATVVLACVVIGVVAFAAAFALSAATEGEAEPAPTARDVLAAGGGAAELPLLEPTSVGGFVHPDVLAAEAPVDLETADVPPDGAGPTFEVAEGEPATPDVLIEDDQFADFADGTLEVDRPERREPGIVWPGLDEEPTELLLPETDDIDGTEEAPGGTGGGTTGTSESGAGTAPTTVVTGPDEVAVELPGLVDPCAEEPSLPGCGRGIGGTLIPASHELLTVRDVSAAITERCEGQIGDIPRDRLGLMILSNDRGRFQVSYRDASDADGEFEGFEVITPDSEAPYAERHETVQTCVAVDRLDGATRYEVEVRPTALDDDAPSLPWTGLVDVPREGRPPVRLEPRTDRILEAHVPAADGEVVEVWTSPRADDATESSCGELEALRAAEDTGARGIALHREVNRVPLASTGAWDPSFTTVRQHDIWLTDESAVDLCIIWYRDLAPEREVVERRSWMLLPPAHPEALFVATGFVDAAGRGVRLHGGDYPGVIVNVEDPTRRASCSSAVYQDDLAAEGEELFCSFEVTPERAAAVFELGPVSPPGPPVPAAYRATLALRDEPCWDADGCVETYAVGVPGPEVDGERTVLGTFQFEIRYSDTPIRSAEWVTTSTGTFDTPESAGVDHVQLDLGNTRVVAHPFDPFKVLLEWQSDEPVEGAYARGEAIRDVRCRRNESPDALMVSSESTFEGDHGVIVLSVCPGLPYQFGLALNDGETTYTWTPSPTASDGPRPQFRWRDGEYTTETVSLRISLDLRTRDPGGLSADARVVPLESEPSRGAPVGGTSGPWDIRYTRVQVGDEVREPEGAYGTYECGSPSYHDTTSSDPFVVEAGPQVGFQLSTQIYRFSACGLFGNVPATAGGKKADWLSGIYASVGVGDLVDGEWRLQDWAWTWPNMGAKCAGRPYIQVTDARTGREAAQKAQEFHIWNEGLLADAEDEGPREVGGVATEAGRFCNPPPNHRVTMTIDTELAGVVYSAADGVETAAG